MTFDASTVQVAETTEIVINHPATGEPFLVDAGEADMEVEVEVEETDPETGETRTVKKTTIQRRPVKKPMIVEVYGPSTKQYNEAKNASEKAFMLTFHRGKSKETAAQKAARESTFWAACTVAFKHFTYKGLPSDDRETFKACYLDPNMGWLTDQVTAQLGDWASFTQAAPNS